MDETNQLVIYDERIYIPIRMMNYNDVSPWNAGFQQCSPGYTPWPTGPYYCDHHSFHYIASGKGTYTIGDKTYSLKKGDMFYIPKGTEITYCADMETPWSYIWIGFDGEFANLLSHINDYVFKIDGEIFEKIKEASQYTNMREIFLASCILEILCKILDNPKKIDIVSYVKAYINETTIADVNIASLASNYNMNPNYLSQLFKKETGISLNEYLVKKKMKIAQNYINMGHNLSEVARLTGYSELSAFSRAYKKYFGCPPSKEGK